jgi:hypothetical protein
VSPVMQSLATSMELSRLDYCNCVLFGLPASSIRRLKRSRMQLLVWSFDHVTDALINDRTGCESLSVSDFNMAVMALRSIRGLPPSYLVSGMTSWVALGVIAASSRPWTQLSSVGDRSFPQLLVPRCGTTYRHT